MALSSLVETRPLIDVSREAAALRHWSEPLQSPLAESFAAPFQRYANARVAYVWFDETRAVTPFGSRDMTGTPEIYPFGL
jgi:hypothetical protein